MTMDKAFRGFGYALGAYLNHPDRYKGRWAVKLAWGGKVYWRECSNHTTAEAWAKYITRKHGIGRTGLRKLTRCRVSRCHWMKQSINQHNEVRNEQGISNMQGRLLRASGR